MKFSFPLPDVIISEVPEVCAVKEPVYTDSYWQVGRGDAAIHIPEVGSFYMRDGLAVEFSLEPGADPDWVNLYLNGQVLWHCFTSVR